MGPARVVDVIHTPRFALVPLTADHVTPRYSAWFDEETVSKYIAGAKSNHGLESLRTYVKQREGRDDILFLGIFTRAGHEHIGNIKYEPVDVEGAYAVMGILIGEREWRGKDVAQEVIRHSAAWLRRARGIREVFLGVADDNAGAIRAYEKAGFRRTQTDRIVLAPGTISMGLSLDA